MADLDLTLQRCFFQAGGNSWAIGSQPFWKLLYKLGVIPAATIAILSGIGYLLSWFCKTLRPWRRIQLFLYLVMIFGPGVIVNSLLKDSWGRPRPRDVFELGGNFAFEPVLTIDPSSTGVSFPSGHAAMGFYILTGFFIFRRHRKSLARGCLIGGIALGSLIGLGRMVQGGHFLSDVLWAGIIVYYTSLGLYYTLGLDRNLLVPHRDTSRQIPLWAKLGALPLAFAVLAGILLGTPYRLKWEAPVAPVTEEEGSFDVRLVLSAGEVELIPSDQFGVAIEDLGWGVPTSRIKRDFVTNTRDEFPEVVYQESLRGWFYKLNSKVTIRVPWHKIRQLSLMTSDADVRIFLAEVDGNPLVEISAGAGDVRLFPAGQSLHIEDAGGQARFERSSQGLTNKDDAGVYTLKIDRRFLGVVTIEEEHSEPN